MFTGLIEGVGTLEGTRASGPDAVLTIRAPFDLSGDRPGDSIAVSGACLTATAIKGQLFEADVSAETLSKTKLGRLGRGDAVNLERALKAGDRLGGHIVSGHIDGLAKVSIKEDYGGSLRFRFNLDPALTRYIIVKGSVAVDGISLTVNDVGPDWFEVNIIPHTAAKTTLALIRPGSMVNIETDLIGKYVERLLGPHKPQGGLTMETLARSGFLR